MLATKLTGHCFPQELVDMLTDELIKKDAQIVQQKVEAKSEGFYWEQWTARKGGPAEREVQRQLDESGVRVSTVRRNENIPVSLDPHTSGRVILRASKHSTRIGMVSKSQSDAVGTNPDGQWDSFRYGPERIRAMSYTSDDEDSPSLDYMWYYQQLEFERRSGRNADRHLHCAYLDETIASWDEERARRFIEKLGLEVVAASAYDSYPMRPKLISLQSIGVSFDKDSRWWDLPDWRLESPRRS